MQSQGIRSGIDKRRHGEKSALCSDRDVQAQGRQRAAVRALICSNATRRTNLGSEPRDQRVDTSACNGGEEAGLKGPWKCEEDVVCRRNVSGWLARPRIGLRLEWAARTTGRQGSRASTAGRVDSLREDGGSRAISQATRGKKAQERAA